MRIRILATLFLIILITVSCSEKKGFKVGYAPNNSPLTLWIDNNGNPTVEFQGSISTPLGTFKFSNDSYITSNQTYVELVNLQDKTKIVFELLKTNSSFTATTDGHTQVDVYKKKNSTIVRIASREITDYLYTGPQPKFKPTFPEQPFPSFWLCKKVNVDWTVNNFWDFLADIVYVLIYLILGCIDIILMVLFFVFRLIWWLLTIIWYVISSMF